RARRTQQHHAGHGADRPRHHYPRRAHRARDGAERRRSRTRGSRRRRAVAGAAVVERARRDPLADAPHRRFHRAHRDHRLVPGLFRRGRDVAGWPRRSARRVSPTRVGRERDGALVKLLTSAFDSLASARNADPFSVLGPHVGSDGVVIRTFQPAADRVAVARGDETADMTRVHSSGVFEACFREAAGLFDYRLRVVYPGGFTSEIDDPYRYGRVISDYDLYLFGEGNHTRIYDKLGAHIIKMGLV